MTGTDMVYGCSCSSIHSVISPALWIEYSTSIIIEMFHYMMNRITQNVLLEFTFLSKGFCGTKPLQENVPHTIIELPEVFAVGNKQSGL